MHLPALAEPRGDRLVVGGDDERGAGVARRRRAATSTTCAALPRSSCPVGSSARISRGSPASARATATRCAWPPESSSGSRSASSASPSAGERPQRGVAARRRPRARRAASGSATFSSTVSGGEQARALEDDRDRPGAQRRRSPASARCRGRRVEPGEKVQQRGLARARRADECDPAPARTAQSVGCSATRRGARRSRRSGRRPRTPRAARSCRQPPVVQPSSRSADAATAAPWVTTSTAPPASARSRSSPSDLRGGRLVELAGRLVGEHHAAGRWPAPPRGPRGRARRRRAAAARACARAAIPQRSSSGRDAAARRRGARQPLRQRDVRGHRRGGRRGWPAGRGRRCAGRGCGRAPPQGGATAARRRRDRAAVGLVEPRQAGQQRRLARAGRAR